MRRTFKAIKEEFRFRKAVALLLLIAAGAFLVLNTDSLYYTAKRFYTNSVSSSKELYKGIEEDADSEEDLNYVRLADGVQVTQTFTAEESKIQDLRLLFKNEKYYEADGEVTISLEDSDGENIASSSFEANQIRNKRFLVSSFVADSNAYNSNRIIKSNTHTPDASEGIALVKGDQYVINISCDGISADDDLEIALIAQKDEKLNDLDIGGEPVTDKELLCFITYSIFSYPVLLFFLVVLLIAALLAIFPWDHLSSQLAFGKTGEKHADVEKWFRRLIFIATPAICFWMNYKITDHKLTEIAGAITSKYGPFNLAILTALLLIVYVISNSTKAASAITTLVTTALLTSCYFLILFRDLPLRACDFSDAGTAADVASNYEFAVSKSLLWIIMAAACVTALNISFKRAKGIGTKPRIALLIAVCVLCGGLYTVITNNDTAERFGLQIKGFDQAGQYKDKGYVLGFALSFRDLHIQKPEGYTVEKAAELARGYPSDKAASTAAVSESSPNIIVIMNEAFSDLSVMGEVETNKEYMPFFNSLEENAVKGRMHVSTFGGGTSKTEYEFLTGNTDAFLSNVTAYTNLIRDEKPSLARTLKDQGYKGSIAFHPGKYDSYNRNNVYPLLGFEEYISINDLENPEKIREYVSDRECYDEIIRQYENHKQGADRESPFFLFNVTIQNHGGFAYDTGVVDAGIEISDPEIKLERPEQYLNLIKISDDSFRELIGYFSEADEPTVVVMFGDHLPALGTGFYEEMAKRTNDDMPVIERRDRRFQVPFVIWANYDIEEEEDVDISANMLSAYMLDKLGLRMTGYDKFLVDLHSRIPSLSSIAYYDSRGKAYEMDADKEDDLYMKDDIRKYHYLQYNNMSKSSERIENFFTLAK